MGTVRHVFGRRVGAAESQLNSNEGKEVRGGVHGAKLLRTISPGEIDAKPARVVDGKILEDFRLLREQDVLWDRSDRTASLREDLHQENNFVRVGIVQGPKQDIVHDGEDRGGRADAESHRQQGDDREARALAQHAQAEADVLRQCFKPRQALAVTVTFVRPVGAAGSERHLLQAFFRHHVVAHIRLRARLPGRCVGTRDRCWLRSAFAGRLFPMGKP